MRTKLVFPPRTSPTYVPIGIASLYSVAEQNNSKIGIFDANLDLWNQICDANCKLSAMRKFCHSQIDIFLTQSTYERNFSHMPEARQKIDSLEKQAKLYLEHEELSAELTQLLIRQSIQIYFGNPETIAFSAMYPDQLAFALAQAKYLASVNTCDCDIVIGGAAMSAVSPVELMQVFPFITAIFTGEGEIPFGMFLQGNKYSRIPGCYYRGHQGKIEFSGKAQYMQSLAELPMPEYSCFELPKYFNPLPVLPILGGRGCKWRQCSFCSHNSSFGRHRCRNAIAVIQEMINLTERFGCRHFYFADQYVDPVFLNELCDMIIASKLKCSFHIMARTVGSYTPALLEKAARAGCCWISWGMESGSQKLLNIMRKGTEVNTSAEVIKTASSFGISNLLMMIFGAPGSDEKCLDENFAFIDNIYDHIDGMTASAFVLFENTEFSRNAARHGLQILGKNEILKVNGKAIHDAKLRFKRCGEPGKTESPLARHEIELWERRKIWLGPKPFFSKLCCEHYLLYAEMTKTGYRPKTIKIGA
jgi:hypothetical protein